MYIGPCDEIWSSGSMHGPFCTATFCDIMLVQATACDGGCVEHVIQKKDLESYVAAVAPLLICYEIFRHLATFYAIIQF